MQKSIKKVSKYLLVIIILFVTYLSSLVITSLIPQKVIEKNVIKSAKILKEQGNNWFVRIAYRQEDLKFDNYTDALMINTVYSIDSNHPLESSLLCRKNYIPGVTKVVFEDTALELKSASKYKQLDQVGELNDTVNKDIQESFEYARYWHGYLVLLRPALCITNVEGIRIIMSVVFIMLGIILTFLIAKKINILSALAIGLRTNFYRL